MAVRAIYDAELTPEEFRRSLAIELADGEAEALRIAHIRWFKRRFPTPLARFEDEEFAPDITSLSFHNGFLRAARGDGV